MKRILAFVFILIMSISLFVGCQNNSGNSTELVLRVSNIVMANLANDSVLSGKDLIQQAAEEFFATYSDAKISVRVETFDNEKEDEIVSGAFDTADATDVLFGKYFYISSYIYTGRVVPLDDIISDELRADVSVETWERSQISGRTYMMPFMDSQNILVYNKQIFRNCGLENYIHDGIASWSIAECEEVLDVLAEKTPKNTYPMMMFGKSDHYGDSHLVMLIRSMGSEVFDANGNVVIDNEEGVAALQWIERGMKSAWFPPTPHRLEVGDCTNLFKNGQLAIHMANNTELDSFQKIDLGFVNFPSATKEKGIASSSLIGMEVFDNGNDVKVKAAKAFVKYLMETAKWVECSTSSMPVRNSVIEKYNGRFGRNEMFLKNTENVVDIMKNTPNWPEVREVFVTDFCKMLKGTKTPEETAVLIQNSCNAAIEKGRNECKLHE